MSEQRDEPQGHEPQAQEPQRQEPEGPEPEPASESTSQPATQLGVSTSTDLADGEWHRLHPATPLFRGGIAFIVVLGIVISNFRDRAIDFFFGGDGDFDGEGDPIDFIVEQELVLVALLALIGVLLLFIAGFWLSWRLHTFRITDEVVEVRSGILFRTNRKGRLDRIQGVNVGRPFIPRLFGAAKLEVSVAGNDANVQLSYLHSRTADALRADILRLASGARREASGGAGTAAGAGAAGAHDLGGMLDERVSEFLAPELDPALAEPEAVLRMNPGRLIGSTVLSETTIVFVLLIIGLTVGIIVSGELFLLVGFLPALLGLGGYLVSRITRSLRYSIASTPDGVRVGFGLLSTTNETLPPGRIHSVRVSQPLLWRPSGWWQIAVNRASRSSQSGAAGQQQTTILPVGNLDDVRTVLRLLLPDVATDDVMPVLERGLTSSGRTEPGAVPDGYVNSPPRARILRWFSQPRNGFAVSDGAVMLRRGAIWRDLTIVPFPRMQSVSVRQGPLLRSLRLAAIQVHTVAGPITPSLGALDVTQAMELFDTVAGGAISSAQTDRTHRWRSGSGEASGSGGAGE
ncbi:PH domain-containing protein [Chryseoglobus sp. 28M-23]|uniref:PH domain-containing protein n=1 Tax=Chryseoglobus sp. 28M-23 TaxID=2772253 RepID=UPI001745D0E9|nr:PH domain-containing protein [Chryseoglobus sp. 28M-23]QOD93507.1 PH domain-containing protein [Chryseoglobus sp. 28M-23]